MYIDMRMVKIFPSLLYNQQTPDLHSTVFLHPTTTLELKKELYSRLFYNVLNLKILFLTSHYINYKLNYNETIQTDYYD